MIIDLIDQAADQFSSRYSAHTLAVEGLLRKHANSPSMDTQAVRRQLREDMMGSVNSLLSFEVETLYEETFRFARLAIGGEPDDVLNQTLIESVSDISNLLTAQVQRDGNVVAKHFNDMSIKIGLMQKQRGWSRTASIVAVKQEYDKEIQYKFTDRSGKRWGSSRYIRTLVRGHLLNVYNESLLYSVAIRGINKAYIHNKNEAKETKGTPVFIAPTGEGQLYSHIRGSVFHPNSNSYVSKEKDKSLVTG